MDMCAFRGVDYQKLFLTFLQERDSEQSVFTSYMYT